MSATPAAPRGPLAPEIYDTARPVPSWWEESAEPDRVRAALAQDLTAEVAIIGGGYAGLSCARRLARLGIGAAVLEGARIGWGASGRNGGIVGPGGHKLSDARMQRRYGAEEVGRYIRAQTDNIRALREFCEESGLGAHVQGTGEALFAHSARMARTLAHETGGDGIEIERIAPAPGPGLGAYGGIVMRPAFGIHPLLLVRALADAAEAAGAQVFPESPVLVWERAGAGHRLVTPGCTVTAETVVVATNGFSPDGLHPQLDARAVPVISNIVVTRPLTGEERAAHPQIGADPACDTRHMLCYLRLLPCGRLLFGGRGNVTGSDAGSPAMRRRLEARLAREFPGLAGIETTHFWRGPICATARLTSTVGWLERERRIAVALGWHGSGIGMGTLGGRMVADLVAGGTERAIPAPMRGTPPRLPLPGLRPVYVAAAIGAMTVEDWLS